MRLSKRLQYAASRVHGTIAADIGCDHGYVIAKALVDGQIEKGYACDNKTGPLNHAKETVRLAGLEDRMLCLLSDGLKKVPEDPDQIIILGMGGSLMCRILEDLPRFKRCSSLLLSPHKDPEILRGWLYEHGWQIVLEKFVEDDGFYPVIEAVRIEESVSMPDQDSLFHGVNVMADEEYRAFLIHSINRWEAIFRDHPQAASNLLKAKYDAACRIFNRLFNMD